MKTRGMACVATLLVGFSVPPMAFARSTDVTSLLNMANQMNNQEEANAKELRSKAGDNQALVTMADAFAGSQGKSAGARSFGQTEEHQSGRLQTESGPRGANG